MAAIRNKARGSDNGLAQTASRAIGAAAPRKSFRAVAGTQPVPGRKYGSPAQLENIYPYSRHSWRLWVYQGRIPGCLKPNGKRGRLLIPLDEAEKLMQAGAQS
ncbi:MAG TPA: hypothetical protein VMA34_02610 [Terracidiphilus sp.]|nr:hypothetical protein [Terracidiphilus sp.]